MISILFRHMGIRKRLLVLVALCLLTIANRAEASKEPVRVGIYDMEPLCETGVEKESSGLFVELLKHIALQEQWDLQFVVGTLDNCLEKLVQGKIDLLMAADYSKANEQVSDFTRETVISTWGRVYGPRNTGIGSLLDLSGSTVGVVRDDPYNQGLRELLKRFNITCTYVEFNHSKGVFEAIEKGYVDAGVVDRLFGALHQGEYGVGKTPIVLTPVELRFAVPKGKNRNLIEALDYHVKKMKEDPNSVYYTLVNGILGQSGNSGISGWLIWGTGIAALIALFAGGISLFLKQQVRAKTALLIRKNEALDAEVQMRKETRKALLQSEMRYRSLVENTLDGYFVFEYPSGEILFLNGRICELLGYLPGEAYQKTVWDFLVPEDREALERNFEREFGEKYFDRVPYNCTAVRKDRSTFRAETSISIVLEQGKTVVQGTLRDTTEQERLKQHLQHAEKMEALGTLAGGIAHDFNNLLMGILGNASLMRMDLDARDPHDERLKHIEEYVQSGSELTRQLLGVARGGKYEVRELDLNEVLEKTGRMFGRTRKEIEIHTSWKPNLGTVAADRGQIEQVLLNMYVNAWHAMPHGGDLFLQTEKVTVDEGHVRAKQGRQGDYIRISITDTGIGMDKETQKRIFEPFFTTKEIERGTGLGLASAYGIIKNHGGFIDVYSEKGKGTTFNIHLPVSQPGEHIHEASEIPEKAIQKGEGTVLVVDDEEMVAEVGALYLKKIGYDVLVARSGEEALRIYQEREGWIDMVILDMIMPGMGGGETFEGLKRIDQTVKVILSSGYSINSQATEILNRGCLGFIQKPFTMAELSSKLREVASAN
jgi:two-component system cell cycle sensor histidine kinase/response regulator CckA